jgi:predicted dehydrogenase
VRVVAVTDLVPEAAAARAAEYGIERHGSPDLALDDPDVEIVLNLTIPSAHVAVDLAAIRAGKHVFSEKPIALDRASGQALLAEATERGLRVGCAPDTFLGAGLQTARRVIERGDIGVPLTALTLFQVPGPGGGTQPGVPLPAARPLFDMGPYYITALTQIFGSFRRVAAMAPVKSDTGGRVGTAGGEEFDVECHPVSLLGQFDGGASSTSIFSFESPRLRMGFVEITGTEAVLSIRTRTSSTAGWGPPPRRREGRPSRDGPANGRGLGCSTWRGPSGPGPHRVRAPGLSRARHHGVGGESIESGAFVELNSSAPSRPPSRRTGPRTRPR